jgi:Family of unknown function (DUF6297)
MTTATAPVSVRTVRSFIRVRARRNQRRHWYDWYAIGFAVALAALFLDGPVRAPLSRLTAPPAGLVPAQAGVGIALTVAAGAGLLGLALMLGPVAVAPADASWLLLTPLDRRRTLLRPVAVAAVLAALAGAVLGVLAFAMAAPYLPSAAAAAAGHPALGPWVTLSAVAGAGLCVAAVLAAILAQPSPRGRAAIRAALAAVLAVAVLGAMATQRWPAVSDRATSIMHGLSVPAVAGLAAGSIALAAPLFAVVLRRLPRFPAATLLSASARASTTLTAAAFLNLTLLTWIAEDAHWRGRRLTSRPWPRLSPAWALAWTDWRRLARRPGLLAALAVSVTAPVLAGAAVTGRTRGLVLVAVLLLGAVMAGLTGTAGLRRDTSDRTLRTLLGADTDAVLRARAVLPALLSAGWLLLAGILLVATGLLSGWLWPPLCLAGGPAAGAAALRIARTGPVDPAGPVTETTLGPIPAWLVTRTASLVLALIGWIPAARAVFAERTHASTILAEAVLSAGVLAGYLAAARTRGSTR